MKQAAWRDVAGRQAMGAVRDLGRNSGRQYNNLYLFWEALSAG